MFFIAECAKYYQKFTATFDKKTITEIYIKQMNVNHSAWNEKAKLEATHYFLKTNNFLRNTSLGFHRLSNWLVKSEVSGAV